MIWHTLFYDFISEFMSSWPAHGLPEGLQSLSVLTDNSGKIVGVEAFGAITDGVVEIIDTRSFDGPAFEMLVQDCALCGEMVNPMSCMAMAA